VESEIQKTIEKLNKEYKWFGEEELENTAGRIERFFEELKSKELLNLKKNFTTFENPNYDQLIILKDIQFWSLCSHHLLPFFGKVHIGYLPDKKICGISKLARAVDAFASKPQIQEGMTQEIVDFIHAKLKPKFVMVIVEGQHLCMQMRGIRKEGAIMITSAIKGRDTEGIDWKGLKREMLGLIT